MLAGWCGVSSGQLRRVHDSTAYSVANAGLADQSESIAVILVRLLSLAMQIARHCMRMCIPMHEPRLYYPGFVQR